MATKRPRFSVPPKPRSPEALRAARAIQANRCERCSTIFTTNCAFGEWVIVFGEMTGRTVHICTIDEARSLSAALQDPSASQGGATHSQLAASARPSFAFSYKAVDPLGDGQWVLVLPHSDDRPTGVLEQRDGFRVTFTGARELGLPPFGIGHRGCAVYRAGVPEAPVYEHGHTCTEEDDVCSAWQGRKRSDVHPIPKSQSVEHSSERHLRRSIPLAHVAHPVADEWRGCPRRGSGPQLLIRRFQMDKHYAAFALVGMSASATAWSPSRSSARGLAGRRGSANLDGAASATLTRMEGDATAAQMMPEVFRSGRKRRKVRPVCCNDLHPGRGLHMASQSNGIDCSTGIKVGRADGESGLRLVSSPTATQAIERPAGPVVEAPGNRHLVSGAGAKR